MKPYVAFSWFLVIGILLIISCGKSSSGYGSSSGGGNSSGNNISMSGMAFSPASLTVKKGAVVKWTNNDYGAHTVTADNGTSFSSGNIDAGGTFSYTPFAPDTIKYHCTIHGFAMSGKLIVIP